LGRAIAQDQARESDINEISEFRGVFHLADRRPLSRSLETAPHAAVTYCWINQGENSMRNAIAASLVVLFGLAGAARADSDDVKWIAQCLKDNQDAKVDASVIQKYCSCMNDKMSSNETQSITQWEKTHPAERKACDQVAGWK
jgi:hypothetical protein